MKNNLLYKLVFIILALIQMNNSYYIKENKLHNKVVNKFNFGSCFGGFLSTRTDAFLSIAKRKPDLFIWTGDATYLDSPSISVINQIVSTDDFNYQDALKKYNQTYNNEHYKDFRKTTPVIGVWDDHDFGVNNSNGRFLYKEDSKELYLNFLEEPSDSRRREKNKSIDASYSFGEGNKSFKIILIDSRFFKDPSYLNNNDILNNQQWEWLENELKSSETFTFLVTGTQFLPISRGVTEVWYEQSREKLFNLIGRLNKSGVIILSGDVHYAQVMKTFCIHPSRSNLFNILSFINYLLMIRNRISFMGNYIFRIKSLLKNCITFI